MSFFLPKDVHEILSSAGRSRKSRAGASKSSKTSGLPHLKIKVGGRSFTILKASETGFTVSATDVPRLPGLVDLYDGARHLSRCLVVATSEHCGERQYEFKRNQLVADRPALDYERTPAGPGGYLT